MPTYDLTNQKFGKLTAIKKVGRKGSNNIWECLCDCGNTTKATANSLKVGNKKSCGCLVIEVAKKRREDVVGKVFNNITVIREVDRKGHKRCVYGRCICGIEKVFMIDHLKDGSSKSCGCTRDKTASITHGQSYNRLYFVWYSMMTRCYNPKFPDYHNYGGRGIRVCDEWFDMCKFIEDVTPGYFRGLQLDRIDNDAGYSKNNCRWVTRKQNNRNKRTNVFITFNNQTKTIVEWCEIYNLRQSGVWTRIRKGYSPYEVLFGKIKHEPSKMLPHLFK